MSAEKRRLEKVADIDSLPNFRLLATRYDGDSNAIYRSSKPDRLTKEDLAQFRSHGIKTIVDFRSSDEYKKTDGTCLLDKEYSVYKVVLPMEMKPGDGVESKLVTESEPSQDRDVERKHYLINFFDKAYIIRLIKRVPWYLMIIGILHLLYDLIMRNKLKTFVDFFIKHSVNKGGIAGQYKDIADVSGSSVCAAMKLVTDPDNMPVLINCAHGKDRTGIISAFILLCLGMSEDYVKKEYALSEDGLESVRHLIYRDLVEKLNLYEEFTTAKPETMNDFLEHIIRNYKSVSNYLCKIGFGLEDQKRMQENLKPYRNPLCMPLTESTLQNGTVL